MSNPYHQPIPHDSQSNPNMPPMAEIPETNGMGVTGFVISLVGIFLCGIPSLIGLVVSLFALRKEPKGFAIAGSIIGFLGLLVLAASCLFAYATYQASQVARPFFGLIQTELILSEAGRAIGQDWQDSGKLPTKEQGQTILAGRVDAYAQQLVYETDGESFSVRSLGEDGIADTEDDVVAGPFESADSAIEESFSEDDFEFDFEDGDSNFEDDQFEQ